MNAVQRSSFALRRLGAKQWLGSSGSCRHLHTIANRRNSPLFTSFKTSPLTKDASAIYKLHQLRYNTTTETKSLVQPESQKIPPKTSLIDHLRPYAALARIDKPTGTLLLFLPCTWSLTLAAHAHHLPPSQLAWNVFLFGSGAFIMRGAGCTINDMWDRKLDANVARTKDRPLASGQVTPFQALCFTGVQLSAGLAILLQLNMYSIALGASSLALVVVYPFMKRITYWPQFVLGLAFNWGALLGWSAMTGSLQGASQVLLPLYLGSICWTLVYDTIYAHQDKVDDVTAGIKSTALLFGQNTKLVLSAFSTAMVSSIGFGVSRLDLSNPILLNLSANTIQEFLTTGHPFFTAALITSMAHLFWQISTVDLNSRSDCWSKFRSNTILGAIIWLGLILDYTVQVDWSENENE